MKWNILVGSLVLSMGLCAQSYGFGFLDRMLGIGGCGCDSHCCEAKPACGCEAAPACGCEAKPCCHKHCGCGLLDGILGCGCHKGCCAKPACGCEAKPACGCEAAPACGCEAKPCCRKHCGCGLLDGILGCGCHKGCCAKPACGCEAKPACGCEAAPACGCEAKPCCRKSCGCGLNILGCLFGHHGCCAKPACGCEAAPSCGCAAGCDAAPAANGEDMAPMPPAPVVDPSAQIPSKQNVVRASNVVR